MVVQVIGIERKAGEFTSPRGEKILYDNMYYYCQYQPPEEDGADLVGVRTVEYKIKTDKVRDQIEIGDLVEVYFNQYRAPDLICVVQKGESKQ